MNTFWRLFEESIVVQSLITLALVLAVIYMIVTGQQIPDILASALMLVLGFYFGSKVEQQVHVAVARRTQDQERHDA